MTDRKYLVTTSFKYAMEYCLKDFVTRNQKQKIKKLRMVEENEIRDFERTNKIFSPEL